MCVVVSCQGQHLTTAMLHSLDGTSLVPRPSLFSRSSAPVYYTECKPKNKKWGRPGNEAKMEQHLPLGLCFWNAFYKVLHLATKIVICASCFALVKQQDALFFSDWLFYHPSFPYMGINCETDHLRATPYLVLWELRKLHLRSQ